MTAYYLDTSALIKRYVSETGSGWIQNLFQPDIGHFFTTSRLTMPEVYSAMARRRREGSVSLADYTVNINAFRNNSITTYRFIELIPAVIDLARQLLERHPLRANDAVQLASALIANNSLTTAGLTALVFLSADDRLNNVATNEGLTVENPNNYA